MWEGAGAPYDYGNESFTTLISDAEWVPGRSIELNDDAHTGGDTIELTNLGTAVFDGLLQFTYAIHFTYIGTNSINEDTLGLQWTFLQGTSDSDAARILVRYDSQNNELDFFTFTSSGVGFSAGVSIEDDLPHAVVFRYDSANAIKDIWVDGIMVGSIGSQTGALSSDTAHTKVPELFGGHLVTTSSFSDSPRVRGHAWALHSRAWTDDQIRQWSRDPFGPFRMRDDIPVVPSLSTVFTSANLALHHSGASDIGGAIGAALTDDELHNLWDAVSSGDASTGDTEYRCVYVKNTHGSISVANTAVQIGSQPTESNFEIALGAAGKNGTETAVANENTAPATPSFGTGPISIGTLAAGDNYPIWIKRIVPAGAGAATPDSGVLHILGDDPN